MNIPGPCLPNPKALFEIYVKIKYLQSILLTYFSFLIDRVFFFSTVGRNLTAYIVLHIVTAYVMNRVVWSGQQFRGNIWPPSSENRSDPEI
jgi:hypothetical protein